MHKEKGASTGSQPIWTLDKLPIPLATFSANSFNVVMIGPLITMPCDKLDVSRHEISSRSKGQRTSHWPLEIG
jgi:hypothetical protein